MKINLKNYFIFNKKIGRLILIFLALTGIFLYLTNIAIHFGFFNIFKKLFVNSGIDDWTVHPKFMVLCAFGIFLAIFIYLTQRICVQNQNIIDIPRRFLLDVFLLLIISISVAYFFEGLLQKRLDRLPNLFGDEDFHILQTENINRQLSNFTETIITTTDTWSGYGRYPSLTHFFVSILGDERLYFRNGLIWSYFVLTWLASVICLVSPLGRFSAYFIFFAFTFNPLALSYFTNYYSDIIIPQLLFILLLSILSFKTTSNFIWVFVGAISLSLLGFLRQHMLFSQVPLAAIIIYLIFSNNGCRHKFIYSTLFLIVSILPIFLYLAGITAFHHDDSKRLSILNVLHQDYDLLFLMLPVYVPTFLTLIFIKKGLLPRWIFIPLVSQILVYAFFEPGWMPWSRNYITFVGFFVFIAGIYFCARSNDLDEIRLLKQVQKHVKILIFLFLVGIFSFFSSLSSDSLFNENENYADYRNVMKYIDDNYDKYEKIYFQEPLYVPSAFARAFELSESRDKIRSRLVTLKGTPLEILQKIPCNNVLVIIHWNISGGLPRAMKALIFNKFQQSELLQFEIKKEFPSALSNERKGIQLVEGACKR